MLPGVSGQLEMTNLECKMVVDVSRTLFNSFEGQFLCHHQCWPSVINNFVWHNRGYERRAEIRLVIGFILTPGAGGTRGQSDASIQVMWSLSANQRPYLRGQEGHGADSLIACKYCPHNIIIGSNNIIPEIVLLDKRWAEWISKY